MGDGKAKARSKPARLARYDHTTATARLAPSPAIEMAFIAFTLGMLTALIGAVGVVAPGILAALATALHGPLGLTLAAVVRLLLGAALFVAAPRSRAPLVFRVLGAVTFAVGLLYPLIGVARFDSLLDWWTGLDPVVVRIWSACALAIGGLIAYGIIPRDAR